MTCIHGGCCDVPPWSFLRNEGLLPPAAGTAPKRLFPAINSLQELPWLKKISLPNVIPPPRGSPHPVIDWQEGTEAQTQVQTRKGHPRSRTCHGVSWGLQWTTSQHSLMSPSSQSASFSSLRQEFIPKVLPYKLPSCQPLPQSLLSKGHVLVC